MIEAQAVRKNPDTFRAYPTWESAIAAQNLPVTTIKEKSP